MVSFGENNQVIIYSVDSRHPILISISGRYWEILEECNQCGKCCEDVSFQEWDGVIDENKRCSFLINETIDGISIGRCGKEWNKPFACAMFPFNPLQENHIPEYCKYSFNEISKEKFITILSNVV